MSESRNGLATRQARGEEAQAIREWSTHDVLTELDRMLPHHLELSKDYSMREFSEMMRAAKSLSKKTALWWGIIYQTAIERFGEDAHQLVDEMDFSESTLKNYARLSTQLSPDLYDAPVADRHLFAIAQNVRDHEEQKRWVESVKENPRPADVLRKEIHAEQEREVTGRDKSLHTQTIVCPQCAGRCVCVRCGGEGELVMEQTGGEA